LAADSGAERLARHGEVPVELLVGAGVLLVLAAVNGGNLAGLVLPVGLVTFLVGALLFPERLRLPR
jgi:ABC-type Fe3+-siderophore transport system permease subunit